jgi:hypothetical protein
MVRRSQLIDTDALPRIRSYAERAEVCRTSQHLGVSRAPAYHAIDFMIQFIAEVLHLLTVLVVALPRPFEIIAIVSAILHADTPTVIYPAPLSRIVGSAPFVAEREYSPPIR